MKKILTGLILVLAVIAIMQRVSNVNTASIPAFHSYDHVSKR